MPDLTSDAVLPGQKGEHRLLPSLVVLILVFLPLLLPPEVFPAARFVGGPLALVLLVAVVATDPGRIDGRSVIGRGLSIALSIVLVLMSTYASVSLVLELVGGAPGLQNASQLLAAGALVWIDVNLTFSLLYWELDSGGPAHRFHEGRAFPDLAFPADLSPDVAPPGWRPTFVDYLYLGFTNATAFSPTDVMPMRHWIKLVMAVQAMVSLALLSLVIANAVNILS